MAQILAAPPFVLRWSARSGDHGDCLVAALEIACGVTYERALEAALYAAPRVLEDGMSWPQARKAAKKLGFKTFIRKAKSFDLDESTGILHVFKDNEAHAVYLWEGRIIEPSYRQLWKDVDTYLKHHGYKAGSLLVVEYKE